MDLFEQQPHIQPYFAKAYACAVFGRIAKAGFGLGGAFGKGDVYLLVHDDASSTKKIKIGTTELRQVSMGYQAGGQVLAEIIFFESKAELDTFQKGDLIFGADATAVALTASASTKISTMGNQHGVQYGWNAEDMNMLHVQRDPKTMLSKPTTTMPTECTYSKGIAIFTLPLGGFMMEATITGQKFTYTDLTKEEEIDTTTK